MFARSPRAFTPNTSCRTTTAGVGNSILTIEPQRDADDLDGHNGRDYLRVEGGRDGKSQRVMILDEGFAWNGTTLAWLTDVLSRIATHPAHCGFRRMRTVIPIECGQRFGSIADSRLRSRR
jgi:hypothetical protein